MLSVLGPPHSHHPSGVAGGQESGEETPQGTSQQGGGEKEERPVLELEQISTWSWPPGLFLAPSPTPTLEETEVQRSR